MTVGGVDTYYDYEEAVEEPEAGWRPDPSRPGLPGTTHPGPCGARIHRPRASCGRSRRTEAHAQL